MARQHFILKDDQVVAVDLMTWATWFETADRSIAMERTVAGNVSTVFLGLNHEYDNTKPPLLFETMVFGGALDGEMMRYSTLEEARAGHQRMVDRVWTCK